MSKSAWPTGNELVAFMGTVPGFGCDALGYEDAGDIVASVVSELERKTGRTPFLAASSPSTRTFDPPDGRSGQFVLDVHACAVVSVTAYVSGTNLGQILTLGSDYVLEDPNAVALGIPYRRIRFFTPPGHLPQSVQVSARWGYATIPLDVWRAVRKMAAAEAIEQRSSIAGALKREKIGDREREYAASSSDSNVSNLAEAFQKEFASVVRRYVVIPSE